MSETQFKWIIIVLIVIFASGGYFYNNATRQAKDIKACQSVDANWRYNSFNQVFCVPKKRVCEHGEI